MKNAVLRSFLIAMIGYVIGLGVVFAIFLVRYEYTLYLEPDECREQLAVLIREGVVDAESWKFDIVATLTKSVAYSIVAFAAVFVVALPVCTIRFKRSVLVNNQNEICRNTTEIEQPKQRLLEVSNNGKFFAIEDIDYHCVQAFWGGAIISAVVMFFARIIIAALAGGLDVVYMINSAQWAVAFGVSMGVYCVIDAIHKGSKYHISRVQSESAKIFKHYEERIETLEKRVKELTESSRNTPPRDPSDM